MVSTTLKMASKPSTTERSSLYIVGINVTHTIAPPMHDHIARALHLPYVFTPQECPSVEDALHLFRQPSFAGGVVTMPYKKSIMPYLDEMDDLAIKLGATNNVYLTPAGKLRGTNTDWRGIKGCLLEVSDLGKRKPALIIGAGGASRAAVYALFAELDCQPIYVINRDQQEVVDLIEDVQGMVKAEARPEIVHVQSIEQAQSLPSPYYIVGTVPDFEPSTNEEILARDMLEAFLEKTAAKGILLDMCFKPRVTRNIKLARKHAWQTVDGTGIIGHQIEEQWRLWTGRILSREEQEDAWRVLKDAAEASSAINF
jgi:quinate dehydrogenase